jgi:raffinose/stachyose/melibiose transport system substrate-binding protein
MYLATRYAGLEPFQNAVSGAGSFEHPSFEFAGNRIIDWVNRGFFAPGFNGNDEDAGQSRQLMYAVMGAWFVSQVDSENPDFLDSLGVFPFPAYENSTADQNIAIGTAGDNFYHVGTTSPSHQGAFDLIMQLLDEPAVAERIAAQATPPLHGVDLDEMLPLARVAVGIMQGAPAVQLWYDQFLPPEVGQTHLDTLQAIFGLTMTPQEANAAVQSALEAHLAR